MSMKRCPGCGREYRGKSTRAIVDGERKLVCSTCDASAVKVVTRRAEVTCRTCDEKAAVCLACVDKRVKRAAVADLRPFVARIEKLAKVYIGGDSYSHGLRDGLTMAATHLAKGLS